MNSPKHSMVVSPRKDAQIAAARWLAKWSRPLQISFATTGFSVVLMPVLSNPWKEVVVSLPVAGWVFNQFSTFGAWAMLLLGLLLTLFLILNIMVRDYPGGWNPTKEWGFPSPKQVVEKELYPRTRKEEFVFWVDIFFGAIGTTVWLYLPFGVLAYFIRIGG